MGVYLGLIVEITICVSDSAFESVYLFDFVVKITCRVQVQHGCIYAVRATQISIISRYRAEAATTS